MTLRVTHEDGHEQEFQLDGRDEWTDVQINGNSRVVEAFLDPEFRVLLDINRLNNRKVIDAHASNAFARQAQLRTIAFYQELFVLLNGLF